MSPKEVKHYPEVSIREREICKFPVDEELLRDAIGFLDSILREKNNREFDFDMWEDDVKDLLRRYRGE